MEELLNSLPWYKKIQILRAAKEGTLKREKVCAMEIWVELFSGDPKQMTPYQAREINDILRRIKGWQSYTKGTGKLKFGKNYGYQRAFVREK